MGKSNILFQEDIQDRCFTFYVVAYSNSLPLSLTCASLKNGFDYRLDTPGLHQSLRQQLTAEAPQPGWSWHQSRPVAGTPRPPTCTRLNGGNLQSQQQSLQMRDVRIFMRIYEDVRIFRIAYVKRNQQKLSCLPMQNDQSTGDVTCTVLAQITQSKTHMN